MRYYVLSFVLLAAIVAVGCTQQASTPASPTAATSTETINEHCPIMGGDVTPEGGTADWNGETVGFCCDGCIEKWQALSEDEKKAALAKAEEGHSSHDHG